MGVLQYGKWAVVQSAKHLLWLLSGAHEPYRGVGASNFNEGRADVLSGSLPYMEYVFTNCTLGDSGLVVKADKLVVYAFLIWYVSSSTCSCRNNIQVVSFTRETRYTQFVTIL